MAETCRTSTTFQDLVASGILLVGDGYRAKLDELGGSGPFFLRAGALNDHGFEWDGLDAFIAKAAGALAGKLGHVGDVVITTKGNSVGRVGWVPADAPEFVYSPHLSYWRSIDLSILLPRFLYYWSRGVEFNMQLRNMAFGTDMAPYLSLRDQLKLKISLPDIQWQRAIAEVLGTLDDKIAANHRIARTALELARVSFQDAVGKLAVEPATLGELCTRGWLHLGDGYRTKRAEHGRPGLRILRAGDVQVDSIVPAGEDFVSAEFKRSIGHKASEPGDIVMTTKGTVGRVAVVPDGMEQVVYSPQLCYFRVTESDQLVPAFLSAWFRSEDLQRQAAVRMFKSDMAPYINLQDIQSMVVPMVPAAEQRRIGDAQSVLEQAAHAAARENRILASARDTLLPLLIAGKIRVCDAENFREGGG